MQSNISYMYNDGSAKYFCKFSIFASAVVLVFCRALSPDNFIMCIIMKCKCSCIRVFQQIWYSVINQRDKIARHSIEDRRRRENI